MQVIVNADDFGLDAATSKAIAESFANHWINQTTLMVNMPYADEAVKMAKQLGFADRIGLHFNITEGKPLTEEMANSCFVGDDGNFNDMTNGKRFMLPYDSATQHALEKEIEAQIDKYLSYQLPLMHCDSHHHIHMRIPITRTLLPKLKNQGFRTIRRCTNVGLGWGRRDIGRRVRNAIFEMCVSAYGLEMCDTFCDAGNVGKAHGSVEVMVHPRMGQDGVVVNVTDYKKGLGDPMKDVAAALCKVFRIDGL